MSKTAGELGSHTLNNFDSIRVIAAASVLVSHSFPLTYGDSAREPLYLLTGGRATLGPIAVAVFFTISGYLITHSFLRGGRSYQNMIRFACARALRILPALTVTLILLAAVLGPLLTSESWNEYFHDIRILRFVFVNLSFLTFHDGLPGVFMSNPFPGAVDGSLWTLRHEVRCYVIVMMLGVVGLLQRSVLALATISCLVWAFDTQNEVSLYFSCFFAGALLYVVKPPMDGRIAAGCLCILIISFPLGFWWLVWPVFGSYAVLWLALSPSARMPKLAKHGDFSYGIYILAFPVQQIVAQILARRGTWYLNVLFSAPFVVALAAASWFLVERPALALKTRWSGSGRSTNAPAPRGRPNKPEAIPSGRP
jgi:peptidoglycan/LPS O-acetylase OafA/YrhL